MVAHRVWVSFSGRFWGVVSYRSILRLEVDLGGERLVRSAVGVLRPLGHYEFRCVVRVARPSWSVPLGFVAGGSVSSVLLSGMLSLLPR